MCRLSGASGLHVELAYDHERNSTSVSHMQRLFPIVAKMTLDGRPHAVSGDGTALTATWIPAFDQASVAIRLECDELPEFWMHVHVHPS